MSRAAWFKLPGQEGGERTLDEQLLGLGVAMAEAKGLTVWDLGCAEGLIALEFLKAGAARVEGCDYNRELVTEAERLRAGLPAEQRARVRFAHADLHQVLAGGLKASFDIVLALAVIHKLGTPERALRFAARAARRLLVIRLPVGSRGRFTTKHHFARCDVNAVMPHCGFRLGATEQGPRGELVQYWRR